ncbi:hypothetical protein [Altererythrobacter sp.]|uniref:hypothetical protein n=1 Tax=Altererythrobacter sp. TaxID=1872480 RepID=UPI003CFF0A71
MMRSMIILAVSMASPAVAAERFTLKQAMEMAEPYLQCRTLFDLRMIAIETELYGSSLQPHDSLRESNESDPRAEELRQIDLQAMRDCDLVALQNDILSALPTDRGDRYQFTIELIEGAEAMRRSELIFEEGLYSRPIPRVVLPPSMPSVQIND